MQHRLSKPAAEIRVVIFGTHSDDWMQALQPGAAVWALLPEVKELGLVPEATCHSWVPPRDNAPLTMVIPLMERHVMWCPRGCFGLVPNLNSVLTLGNKAHFARHAHEVDLDAYCPRVYAQLGELVYPVVLKRTDLNAGSGVALVRSECEMRQLLNIDPWRGEQVLFQEAIEGCSERVTHAVCQHGRIVWQVTFEYELPAPHAIQRPGVARVLRVVDADPATLACLEAFVRPLRYTGPCNIDYKLREDGVAPIVFEVNPRLGGSLMLKQNVDHLAACLRQMIAHREFLLPAAAG